jgi:type I restriction enzyme S subunit
MGQSPPSAEYSDSPSDGLPFLQGTADFGRVFPEPKIFCASPTKVAVAGAILFSVRAPVGELNIANQDVGIGRGLCSVRSGNALNNHFAWWALHEAREQLNYVSTGSTYAAVSVEDVSNIRLCEEPIDRQRNIADYLDRETARLDILLSEKERLLELLAEKRRALITHAVTRGINPNASLRDSCIPWLGEIPAHWETRRIAWLFSERDERGEPELPLLEVSINTGVTLREFLTDRIEGTAANFNSYKVARKDDVVFNKMRMWQGAVGIAPEDGLVSPDYTVAEPAGEMSSDYAGQLFRTDMFSAECARHSHGIVWDRLRIYWAGFRDIVVPIPPEDEQRAIVAYIASESMKLDALRAAAERTIALSKERRAALISAAVTGKIKTPSLFAEGPEIGV